MKRSSVGNNGSGKRQRTKKLLDVLRQNKELGNIVGTVSRKIGADKSTTSELLTALQTLDTEFTENNWVKVKTVIKQINLDYIVQQGSISLEKDKIDAQGDPTLYIYNNTRVAQATSMVLLDCVYQGQYCVTKVMNDTFDKVDLFMESLINIFMSAIGKGNEFISSPDIIKMGWVNDINTKNGNSMSPSRKKRSESERQYIIIQEKINGEEFSKLTGEVLKTALITLCRGMKPLQDNYNFAHRDFHSGNVMYDKDNDVVNIIDFGYSCFSIPDTEGSVQALEGGYGYNQLEDPYKKHIPCINKSHDLCTLILSLAVQHDMDNNIETWLGALANEISLHYYIVYIKKTEEWNSMNEQIKNSYPDYKWHSSANRIFIIHYWYLYEMFELDIGMGPDVILGFLEGTGRLEYGGFLEDTGNHKYGVKTQFKTLKF